jgi:hypothetical protein
MRKTHMDAVWEQLHGGEMVLEGRGIGCSDVAISQGMLASARS